MHQLNSVVSNYTPPQMDASMGPPSYPPARTNGSLENPYRPTRPDHGDYDRRGVRFKSKNYSEEWDLPSAHHQNGAILTIPTNLGAFDEVFLRWESITKNLVSLQGFTDNNDKAEFIENLLGEAENLTWMQWRMAFPNEYQTTINTADGREGTQNIISQIRRVFMLEDPYQGSTLIQDEAYRDIERLSCNNLKDVLQFMNEYMRIAAKTGQMFTSPERSEKFWSKLPGDLGSRIKMAFDTRYSGNQVGVIPRILFTYRYLENECKEATFHRALKGLQFCNQIPIPGYYKKPEKKYGIRRSTTYKGKPHNSHARIEKKKHLIRNKNCKCFLCGEEGHFARECPNDKKSIKRVAIFEGIDIPDDCEIVSVDEGEAESDAIYSISEGEDANEAYTIQETICYFRETDRTYWVGKAESWQPRVQVTQRQYECQHEWQKYEDITDPQYLRCHCCKRETNKKFRMHCPKCNLTSCGMCSPNYFDTVLTLQRDTPVQYNPRNLVLEQTKYIKWCEGEMTQSCSTT
ncbi:uncharacterized protein LOC110095647 isoform X2 [Dendrobium catenatum]|uniref:uncharacterized protein LOC110095647 isoform X2 n=1 Tax=Dendrobium catenatum TaxID=906689 RepID=UPI0010A05725|nr:uncharacterized protein LOC110095647 isoform X2 [Dendrobium catenatum]XP_028547711.1 uncharacterized protein LOC110095647 isoform X2 [Dendrobium catenatum]